MAVGRFTIVNKMILGLPFDLPVVAVSGCILMTIFFLCKVNPANCKMCKNKGAFYYNFFETLDKNRGVVILKSICIGLQKV